MGSFRCGLTAVVVVFVGCAGSPKRAPDQPEAGSTQGPCEPGRCLDDLSRAIQEHRTEARACYDQGLKRQPGLKGALIINCEIDPAGRVVATSQGMQENQILDADVVDCVGAVIKKITFAKSSAGKTTRAYHRFDFAPH